MPVDRPTFSESWFRVADLRPRLRSTVQVYRQHFRGRMWHVVEDPSSNQFFRLSPAGYAFVAMLDGRRTVADAWDACNRRFGDDAMTQGEVIRLLGQLYTSNLLWADLPPDAEGLFRRYRKRRQREIQSYLMSLLFARIPLIDPDRILDRWVGLVGRLFTWYGLAAWLVLLAAGAYAVSGSLTSLWHQASGILDPGNLVWLYVSLVLVKICHEFSHSFACKKFGRDEGTGGEVHTMGVMFLVFVPLPYMDASSAWTFRRKWSRAVVGLAGILCELAFAAVATIVWSRTAEGSVLHAIAYNVMFIASVSTVLFNGNPLLRFDGYYVLSDLLEIPNLYNRSREYVYYLVRRYAWFVKRLINPAHTLGERLWFVFYGAASLAYRVYISIRILLFLGDRLPRELFFVAILFGLAAFVGWVLVPVGKFLRYMATSGELARVRTWACSSTGGVVAMVLVAFGLTPWPDRCRVEGVVEPVRPAIVHTATAGRVVDFLPSGRPVGPDGPFLVRAENPELETKRRMLMAQRRELVARRNQARTEETALVQSLSEQLAALDEQIARVETDRAALALKAPFDGTWVSPQIERTLGAHLPRGEAIGLVADLERLVIRATAPQKVADLLIAEARPDVEIRVRGRPGVHLRGRIRQILPAGREQLPSRALSYLAGGSMAPAPGDERGVTTAERFFEIWVAPDLSDGHRLLTGQRVVVRFEADEKPLARQWWRSLMQVVQRKFRI